MHFELIIRNGDVIDCTGRARFAADVGVNSERIAAIGDLSAASADSTIDAAGRIVAPGYIDSHMHDDAFVLTHPDVTPKVVQGVTTVIAGNCGISSRRFPQTPFRSRSIYSARPSTSPTTPSPPISTRSTTRLPP